ncbi:MAG: type II toxin-antitoxin system RatA family toxin [Microbacteriaceae bacterium]|nr:type II toxin-antitoxin system RatA family toxin [Burkholderiaceae bacterium]
MKHVKKSVLLWYSAREMYALVTAVEQYPSFLPWCERADVIEQHANGVTARLQLHYAGLRHAFTTRNGHQVDSVVTMALVDGPFSELEGTWRFLPIGAGGTGGAGGAGGTSPAASACRVEFDLRYAFSSRALELVLSPVFDRVANTFVDSFVQRAEQVYGVR